MTSTQAARSKTIRERIASSTGIAAGRYPTRYDWGCAGRGDGSPNAQWADEAEAYLEDRIAAYVSTGDDKGLGEAFKMWLKTLEV